jgi:hypothetical protein
MALRKLDVGWKLKEEALGRTLWRTGFGIVYGLVVRQITEVISPLLQRYSPVIWQWSVDPLEAINMKGLRPTPTKRMKRTKKHRVKFNGYRP